MAAHHRASGRRRGFLRRFVEALEERRLLSAVTLNPSTVYQTIQGWGTAAVYPTNLVTIAQAGTIMRDAGMNVVRVTPGPNDYTYTVGGNMRTPVPISANLDQNVARFYPGQNDQTNLINWLETNGLEPDRTKMIGSLWSPPHWMKITTGTLLNWDNNGPQSGYDPIIPWGDYGGNTGAGRVNPTMWTDWARYVLSTVKSWQQKTGLPMYAFSFQNEPNVPTTYNSASFQRIANDVNNPSAGGTDFHWELYGDAVQALATELASHPEITTKFFGPELSQLGGGASNPYNLPAYNAIRQNLISRGLLNTLGAYATHEYTYPADDSVMWDAWYNGSQHAANIVNGTNNLGWLGPTPGIAGDNKEIWQTETDGEDQTWTKDGAMGFGLKIFNSLVYGNVSGYTSWTLTGYNSSDQGGVVDLDDINNPTNSYKYDAFKQFSRWIRPGAQRIDATFANGKASTGGANALDSYNGLNVAAFNHAADKRLTMVFVNMKTTSDSTTITIPASFNVGSFQVYQTSGTQKYVQLANLTPVNGQITLTVPASSFVTITGAYATSAVPTIVTAPSATPNPVTGTSAALSVLGADDGGEANLTYTWAVTGTPPAAVTFSSNGTNAAKNSTATFTKAGTYSFQVTVTDASAQTVVGTVNVTVGFGAFTDSADIGLPATAGSLSYTPATTSYVIQGGGADVWGASDQFRFSYAPITGNRAVVARVNSVTNTDYSAKAGVMFRDSTAANAAYAFAWLAPGGLVHFETRSANATSASYSASATAGAPVWIKIIRAGASSNQFSAFFSLNGSSWSPIGTMQTITMASAALAGLGVTSHNNTVGTLNTASFDNVSLNAVPTVVTPAFANPSPVTGASTALTVLGADDAGESALTYTWSTTGMPPAPVTFSLNGNNAAKSTLATFTKAGSYNFQVTITDAGGLAVTSSVAVTVNQTPTTVTVTPTGLTLAGSTAQQYAASALDQFNQTITSPSFSWSASGGTISSSGLYSAAQTGGNFSVTATCGSANGSAPLSIVPTLYTGGSGADQYYLKLSGSTLNIWLGDGTGSPTYMIAYGSVPSLSFNGNDGDDSLTVDCSTGNPIPAGGISFDGGNGMDTLKLIGTSGDDIVTANASSVNLGRTINTPNVESRSFAGQGGQDSLSVSGGTWSFDADTLVTTLNLSNSASASAAAGGAVCLQITNLTIDPASKLDLQDNKLIVRGGDIGSWNGSVYGGISGLIALGRNGGAWDGTGIMTGKAQAASQLTTLAVATADSVQKTTFAGIPVSATDVLVMYTYAGDATLDGKINVDDYIKIDNGIASGLTGYSNGDFNYDGKINIDDYTTAIDRNIASQGPPLGSGSSTQLASRSVWALPSPLIWPATLQDHHQNLPDELV